MHSLILRTGTRLLLALMVLFSLFILWRGHNEPGGGFIGGLIAAVAYSLVALSFGVAEMRRMLPADPKTILGAGLALAIVSGLFAVVGQGGLLADPYMASRWYISYTETGEKGFAIGTPVLFDIGVYLVVIGGILAMVRGLMEEL
ncbi:Na(+)/H(+) antiporter subunit B [Aerophototrophica crusticola]|uniref:Na(+)/H(+) antiporter subunit B n=1 Tax=Aerophototrophica crusticola TaxID=1709002 RepID=A0A858R7E9_9PROT|nr:Na(+)/H(+) antiporter subunit B [Rhodospirillaceae bacterium B3]